MNKPKSFAGRQRISVTADVIPKSVIVFWHKINNFEWPLGLSVILGKMIKE